MTPTRAPHAGSSTLREFVLDPVGQVDPAITTLVDVARPRRHRLEPMVQRPNAHRHD